PVSQGVCAGRQPEPGEKILADLPWRLYAGSDSARGAPGRALAGIPADDRRRGCGLRKRATAVRFAAGACGLRRSLLCPGTEIAAQLVASGGLLLGTGYGLARAGIGNEGHDLSRLRIQLSPAMPPRAAWRRTRAADSSS